MSETRASRPLLRLPDSIFGQLLCILLLGVALLQVANFSVVCMVQWLYVSQAERTRAEHLAAYWFLFDAMSPEQRQAAVESMADAGRPEDLRAMMELLPERPDWKDETRNVKRLLSLAEESFGGARTPPLVARRHESGGGIFPVPLPVLETAVRLTDGSWLKVTEPFDVDERSVVWPQRLFVLLVGAVMTLLTALLLLRVTRPIRSLSEAAEFFGRRPELSEPFPEEGVKEVRDAAQSFNGMRGRVLGALAERDRMLAALAHDLRTPLTKLQLRLERVEPEELRGKLQGAVTDMRSIISQSLELASSLNTEEERARLDMRAFLQSVADDYADVGWDVRLAEGGPSGPLVVEARPLCLKRCLENLVSNACKYGGGAELSLSKERGRVVATVADRGPGVPEDMLERVFEPYFRLEGSRSRSSGGTGLGLAIARNMALLNNGELSLRNREGGGLEARIVLPWSA